MPYLALALCCVAMAVVARQRKSVLLAIVTLVWACLQSAAAVLAAFLLPGAGKAIVIPFCALTVAILGLKAARALSDEATPLTACGPCTTTACPLRALRPG